MKSPLLESYREDVEAMIGQARKGKEDRLPNPDREHAAALLEAMFASASESISILCHHLSADIYGRMELYHALKQAYERNPKLKCEIYLRASEPDQTRVYDEFLARGATIIGGVARVAKRMPDAALVDRILLRKERSPQNRTADFYTCTPEEQNKTEANFKTLKEKCVPA